MHCPHEDGVPKITNWGLEAVHSEDQSIFVCPSVFWLCFCSGIWRSDLEKPAAAWPGQCSDSTDANAANQAEKQAKAAEQSH